MFRIGFDNQHYLETQSARIRDRIGQFGGKLYLEFGGKLFDDYHASRVLPGFEPDSKVRMLQQLRDDVEIVVAICARDIEKNKVRGDLGIPYEEDVLRLIDELTVDSRGRHTVQRPGRGGRFPPAPGGAGGTLLPPLPHRRLSPQRKTDRQRRGVRPQRLYSFDANYKRKL